MGRLSPDIFMVRSLPLGWIICMSVLIWIHNPSDCLRVTRWLHNTGSGYWKLLWPCACLWGDQLKAPRGNGSTVCAVICVPIYACMYPPSDLNIVKMSIDYICMHAISTLHASIQLSWSILSADFPIAFSGWNNMGVCHWQLTWNSL